MSVRCNQCGADNRDAAHFCQVCGQPLPALAPQPPRRAPLAPPAAPLAPAAPPRLPAPGPGGSLVPGPPPSPIAPPLIPSQPPQGEWADVLSETRFLMRGVVLAVAERRDAPPSDPARALFTLALGVLLLPVLMSVCLVSAVSVGLVVAALLAVGLSSMLVCLGPILGIPALLLSFLRNRRPSRDVPFLELRLQEAGSGRSVNLTLVGKRQGGLISQGDEIEAWGRWDDAGHGSGRVWRIKILAAPGALGRPQAAGSVVRTAPPFSRWAALTLLLLTLLVIGLVYLPALGIGPRLWQP